MPPNKECVEEEEVWSGDRDDEQEVWSSLSNKKNGKLGAENSEAFSTPSDRIRDLKNSLNLFIKYLHADCNKGQIFAGAGDTNIRGGVIRLYWGNILRRCLDVNEQVHQSALKEHMKWRSFTVCEIHESTFMNPQEGNSKLAHHL
ncbi:hypothetical protein RHGRI_030523 [Rhododendron griersonianum]|uniref:Uncharacterized protein n=1 Tax=Rhododendron griersonianum TaxID=479676 RepID=A0AAV6IN78_9ERIC|nr:hypothetical protein RHGRI_030523 [Rhododendron griersonianum]